MPEQTPDRPALEFTLSLRQRRLRIATAVLLVTIAAMVLFGVRHPFFRSAGAPELRNLTRQAAIARRAGLPISSEAARARRIVTLRLTIIAGYWSACILLCAGLFVLAWMDVREVRRKLLRARRGIVHDVVRSATKRDGRDGTA